MSFRVALAGAGMASRHHLEGWARAEAAEVVAIADPDREAAERRAREFGIPAAFADPGEMLERTGADLMDIAAPVGAHAAIVDLGCRFRLAGILCQKPLAATLPEAEQVARRVACSTTRLMVHENWRFRPHYVRLREWLATGSIGEPRQFRLGVFSSGLLPSPDGLPPALARQPFMARMERLLVLELLVHHLDTLQMLLGPLEVHGAALARLSDAVVGEDTATIHLASSRVSGTICASLAAHGCPPRTHDDLQILGTEGRISLGDGVLERHGKAPLRETFNPVADYQRSYDAAIAHFVDAMAKGAPFATPPDLHLHVLGQVGRIYDRGCVASPAGGTEAR